MHDRVPQKMTSPAIKPRRIDKNTSINKVRFVNYKAFADFTLILRHLNVLVGPNNCGKSTILSAFRVLSAGLSIARSRKPEIIEGPLGSRLGYHVRTKELPFSFENVHTDLADTDTQVFFELTNETKITLYFPKDGGCRMFCTRGGSTPNSPNTFKSACPIVVNHIPVLGPVEYGEEIIERETVKRGLNTHRASSHFRNYWYYNTQEFEKFRTLLQQTWVGADIRPPEREIGQGKPMLFMTCMENRMARELYWAGFGFQVWCQLLTHIARSRDANLLRAYPRTFAARSVMWAQARCKKAR